MTSTQGEHKPEPGNLNEGNLNEDVRVVLYDFQGTLHDELSVLTGARVIVSGTDLDGWCTCSSITGGVTITGLIPGNYLTTTARAREPVVPEPVVPSLPTSPPQSSPSTTILNPKEQELEKQRGLHLAFF